MSIENCFRQIALWLKRFEGSFTESQNRLTTFFRYVSLDESILLYIIVTGVMAHLVLLPEIMKSLLSLPSFVFIPFLLGKAVVKVLSIVTIRLKHLSNLDFPSYLIIHMLIGFYSIWSLALLMGLLRQSFLLKNLHIVLVACSGIPIILRRAREFKTASDKSLHIQFVLVSTLLLISITSVVIARRFTPFPMLNLGPFTNPAFSTRLALRLVDDGVFSIWGRWVDFLPVAVVSSTFNISPESFLWSAPLVLAVLYVSYTYLLANELSNSKAISILTALFAVLLNIMYGMPVQLINTYQSNSMLQACLPAVIYVVYVKLSKEKYDSKNAIKSLVFLSIIIFSFFLLWEILMTRRFFSLDLIFGYPPGFAVRYRYIQPLLVPLLPLIGLFLGSKFKNKFLKYNFSLLFFVSILFYFIHHQMCLVHLFAVLSFIALYYVVRTRNGRGIIYLLSVLCFFYVFLQHVGLLRIYSTNPLTQLLLHTSEGGYIGCMFDVKWYLLEKANTYVILFLSLLGSIVAGFSKRMNDKLMLGLFAVTVFAYFLPEWYTQRALNILSLIMAYMVATGVCYVIKMISDNTSKASIFKPISVGLLLIILLPSVLYPVYETHSFIPSNQKYYTTMTRYEWDAGIWLRKNTAPSQRIISDYGTLLYLNGLANKIWLTPINMYSQGIDWNALYNSDGINIMKLIKDEIFQAPLLIDRKINSSSIEVIYDDYQTEFWSIVYWGSGTCQPPVILNETAVKVSGNDSLKMTFSKMGGEYFGTRIYHQFPSTRDWSNKDFLSLYFYGSDTGQSFGIYCFSYYDNDTYKGYFYQNIIDNWTGWKELVIPLKSMRKVQSPDWSSISQVGCQQLGIEGTYYLDCMTVGNWMKPSSQHAYNAILSLRRIVPWHESYYIDCRGINESDLGFLVVVSPRTAEWIQQAGYDDVSALNTTNVPLECVEIFQDQRFFKEVYSIDGELYIFRVNLRDED